MGHLDPRDEESQESIDDRSNVHLCVSDEKMGSSGADIVSSYDHSHQQLTEI